jgi:hypothetical protein
VPLFVLYLFVTLIAGIAFVVKSGSFLGLILGFIGYFISTCAAMTVKGLWSVRQLSAGHVLIAIALFAIFSSLAHKLGYWVGLFGHEFSGYGWATMGLVVGLVTSGRTAARLLT